MKSILIISVTGLWSLKCEKSFRFCWEHLLYSL